MVDLGTLGGTWSRPTGLSPSGHVVGRGALADSIVGADNVHPFSWTQAGGMVDLGALGAAAAALMT
jgi:probable HAF family extracellular repeat protein